MIFQQRIKFLTEQINFLESELIRVKRDWAEKVFG